MSSAHASRRHVVVEFQSRSDFGLAIFAIWNLRDPQAPGWGFSGRGLFGWRLSRRLFDGRSRVRRFSSGQLFFWRPFYWRVFYRRSFRLHRNCDHSAWRDDNYQYLLPKKTSRAVSRRGFRVRLEEEKRDGKV